MEQGLAVWTLLDGAKAGNTGYPVQLRAFD